jgi:hypothetical protein
MFAHIGNRLDISCAISNVANFMAKPSTMHYGVVCHIFKYLCGNVHLGLCYYGKPTTNILQAYSNVNFTSDLFDRKSCSGFLVSMNGGPILWGSKNQTSIDSLITKDEYVAANIATQRGCMDMVPTNGLRIPTT